MVQQPIEDRGGDDAITEHLAPCAEALVAGQDHGSALVASADQREEEVGSHSVDWQVADLGQ